MPKFVNFAIKKINAMNNSSKMLSPPPDLQQEIVQTINYTGSETEYSAKIEGNDVTVHCNASEHSHGSSKVKLINRIDYNWEFQYYRGQLVAVHIGGKIIAHGMKGKDGGMVRVTHKETDQRAIIKNLKNDVKDLAFSFSRQQIILGCIDDEGNVLIYEIQDEPCAIKYKLLLHVYHTNLTQRSSFRIIWCPFVSCYDEEDDSPDDPEKMFVILNGEKAEIWNFNIVTSTYGSGPIEARGNYDGYVEITHTSELIDASFSSDGTAIAIACLDGYVKFFQIYMVDNEKQKCLHEWRPHDGKPLSAIIFVDNFLESSSQCWKFTITGANHNSELKLWSCETWTCLQTIHFKPPTTNILHGLYLKIVIDYSGQYLVMSDLNNKVLYVLHLSRNDQEKKIYVTNISQFLLPCSFLSFHITETSCRKLRASDLNEEYDIDDEEDDEDSLMPTVIIKMLVIQQKKFQECNIVFQPDAILCDTDVIFEEPKEEEKGEAVPKLDDLQNSVAMLIQQQQQHLNLMTPEAFTNEQKSRPSSAIKTETNDVENLIDFQRPEKDNFASGGSSPSREVQEILSLNNSTYSTQDYFDNLTKMQEDQEIPQKEYQNADSVWVQLSKDNNDISKDETLRQELGLGGGDEVTHESQWNDKSDTQILNFRLTSLENAISQQNVLIQKLYQELKAIKKNDICKEEFTKELELAMSKQHLHVAKMLDNLMNKQKNNERDQQEHIVTNISQFVVKSLTEKLQSFITQEIKLVVLPSVRNLIDASKHQVDKQGTQKFNNEILLFQDKISKFFNSKALIDSLSISVANVITPILEKCYKDMISTKLIPSLEKICGTMFNQLNETFAKGTKEYTASVESYMERQRRVQERGKELITQMQTAADSLQSNTKLATTLTTEMHKELEGTMKAAQENLLICIKDLINEQIGVGFKNHAALLGDSVIHAVRSRAVTPSPHADAQVTLAHIDHLLGKESYDEAFQLALSAENLNFVIYLCEKVDTITLFQGKSPPQQNCVLALIQQLSIDLNKNTETKLSYIRAAVVALIPGYPQTRQFIPKVLKDLLKQLHLFMTANPTSKFMTEAKLIKMAVDSILLEK